MLYLWARLSLGAPIAVGVPSFDLTVTKVSQREEVRTGADLELIVTSPLGYKRALVQAKVLDPSQLELRCASTRGWAKLREQLKSSHSIAPGLAFLLAYVPGSELDGQRFIFYTWEQGFLSPSRIGQSSRQGASFFPVEDLLTAKYRWRYREKVRYEGGGGFQVQPLTLSDLLLDMLTCNRGTWVQTTVDSQKQLSTADRPEATVSLVVGASGVDPEEWTSVTRVLRELRERGDIEERDAQ